LAGKRRRRRVDNGLRVELAAAGEFHPLDLASPVVGAERLGREGQPTGASTAGGEQAPFQQGVPERLGEGAGGGGPGPRRRHIDERQAYATASRIWMSAAL